jgi:hypothetical protein
METNIEIAAEFCDLTHFDEYEISQTHPWTIRNKKSQQEIRPKKKNGYLYVRLNKNDEALHHVIAKQFMNMKNGDKIKFKKQIGDNGKIHIDNYKLENLYIIKSPIENDSDDIPEKAVVEIKSHDDIDWSDVCEYKIDIKNRASITDFIEFTPYNISCTKGIIDCIRTMRMIFASVHGTPKLFVFKDKTQDGFKISYTNKTVAQERLKEITVGKIDAKNITAWDIYTKHNKLFTYDYTAFYHEDPKAFSYFQGYKYKKVKKVNMKLIQPFLNHMKEIICDNNIELYDYIQKYYAKILQNPNCKLEVALVVLGEERTGKNVFTNVLCELLSGYSNENADIQHITGSFNACMEGMRLMVVNELTDASSNKWLYSDVLKKLISDGKFQCRDLYCSVRIVDNRTHFIFVSNNMFCLRITVVDNRYVVVKVSSERRGDHKYFEDLCNGFTEEFYDHLFTYFMEMDLTGFNHRVLPMTEAKKDIVDASKNSYELFLESRYDQIVDITGPDLFNMFDEWREKNKFTSCTSRTFSSNFKRFTGETTTKRINKQVTRVYNLLPEVLQRLQQQFPKEKHVVEDHDVIF